MRFGAALAFVLLLAVAVPHYAYEPLASLWPDPVAAAKAWFYVLRGFSGAVLFATIAVLAGLLSSAVRQRYWLAPVVLICAWGFAEEFETAACRLGIGISAPARALPWKGLCDTLTGLPFYWMGVVALGVIGVLLATRGKQ